MTDQDTELTGRIRQGDTAALGEYLEAYRPQLIAFIAKNLSDRLRCKVEPEDVYSETALTALNSLADVDLSQRDPFGWLCQLAERRIIDAHRHHFGAQKRAGDREVRLDSPIGDNEQGGLVDLLVASMTSPSQAFSRDQREFRLLAAVEQLPEEQRQAIQLRYVSGCPTKQIADKLGKSDGAVRVMLTRALNKLHQSLAEAELNCDDSGNA